jgi:hypothetical protein
MGKLIDHCFNWPDCSCHRKLAHCVRTWRQWKAEEPPDAKCSLEHVSEEDLKRLDLTMYYAYRCMAENCCSREWRANAQVLLLHPVYQDLQRRYP